MSLTTARARLITAPYTLWVAAAGTVAPTLGVGATISSLEEAVTATAWTKVGESGSKNYSEAGVTVTHSETMATFQPAGSTVPRKAWRTDEGFEVALELADLNPEQYALILDEATVVHTAGARGIAKRTLSLYRGPTAHYYAVIIRGPSAENEEDVAQYWVPFAYQAANQAPKFALKGGPAMLAVQFTALEAEPGKFATLEVGADS